ncbi:MAG: SLC13 family permease [Acidimicrobiia bacterium]|nr:SLC13 family permease [Acidimicrobiia bacterium]
MSADAWITIVVLLLAVAAMVRDRLSPAAAMIGSTGVLLLTGVIDAGEAFSGFSNPAPITVALLYVVAEAVSRTGVLQPLVTKALGDSDGERGGLVRILTPVAGASSVLNNTPIVAMLVPEITGWSTRRGRAPSRLLMPLSFAAILGGTITVIGTSTNLIISGLLEASGGEPLGFFEITPIGAAITVVGIGLITLLAPRVLPDRRSSSDDLGEAAREFVIDMVVTPGGPLDGVEVEAGGLRHLRGVFLVALIRRDDVIAPVLPSSVVRGEDRLRFAGRVDDVVDLMSIPGLESGEQEQFNEFEVAPLSFYEVVIGAASPLINRTLKEARFRGRYQAAVVAIHRAGQRVNAKLGEVPLRVGDTLVIVADPEFRARWRNRTDFLLVSPLGQRPVEDRRGAKRTMVIALVAILAAATGVVPVLNAILAAALALVLVGVLTPGQAKNAVDIDVVVTMAGGFGLAAGMQASGLAETIADGLVSSFGAVGSLGALLGVVLATMLLTELVSNAAAALLVFPVAVAAASSIGADPRGFAIAVAVAASASFLSPVGYQTNTMVYGPGGYRYTDYVRLGVPLSLVVITTILILVPVLWPL